MAYMQTSRSTPAVAGARAASLFEALAERVRRYRIYRRTLLELQSLTPRELNDLGLNASMIRSIAYQAAYEN